MYIYIYRPSLPRRAAACARSKYRYVSICVSVKRKQTMSECEQRT